jgi:primosomal protein N' (replication factor Y)
MDSIYVVVAAPLHKPLVYGVDTGMLCRMGDVVVVPLGTRRVLGIVWGYEGKDKSDTVSYTIKSVISSVSGVSLSKCYLDFIERVADYTLSPLGMVVKLALQGLMLPRCLPTETQVRKFYTVSQCRDFTGKMTEARKKVLDFLFAADEECWTLSQLAHAVGVSRSVVAGLVSSGIIEEISNESYGLLSRNSEIADLSHGIHNSHEQERVLLTLSDQQTKCAEHLCHAVQDGRYKTFLLHGVTGSGKTAVYVRAIAECIDRGQQVLVLLPEIALTSEFVTTIEQQLNIKPILWHSSVSARKKHDQWLAVAEGKTQIVVGTRSALFLPFLCLGLVVVDEEHDGSYKQNEQVIYNARDMAVLRAWMVGAVGVLCSATPSLESWVNTKTGKYHLLEMKERYGKNQLPSISIVDLKRTPPERGRWISPPLVSATEEALAKGQQVMFFINRRGYAPLTLCRRCGYRCSCSYCTAWLVEHRAIGRMMCHYCGYTCSIVRDCPNCQSEENMIACGPGIERLAEEVRERFPTVNVGVLSSDLSVNVRNLQKTLEQIRRGEHQIIVGTQILSKGHNFPHLTVVGVIDADIGLYGGDLRASERTWQMMQQVSGRAGRGSEEIGHVFLQTIAPEHPVLKILASGKDEDFLEYESQVRRKSAAPPFGHYVAVIVSGKNEKNLWAAAWNVVKNCQPLKKLGGLVLGPSPAPIALLRGRMRVRILIKLPKGIAFQKVMRDIAAQVPNSGGIRITWDVEPYSFF